MKITTSGIDVAKSVLQVHGVDEQGKVVLRDLPRDFDGFYSFSGGGYLRW